MKKFLAITFFLGILFGLSTTFAQGPQQRAQGEFVEDPIEQEHKLIACMRNFQPFLSSLIGYQDFVEFWKDIGRLNICHRTDIEAVEGQLNRARRQVRAAFLRCEVNNISRIAQNYYKLEVELFFLREAFEEFANADVKYLLQDKNGNRIQTKWNQLVSELKKRSDRWTYFGKDPFEKESLIIQYFQEFESKYAERLQTYNNCRSETWEEINVKLQELVKNFNTFGRAAKKAALDVGREASRGAEDIGKKLNKDILSTEEGLDIDLKLLRLKVTPEKSLRDLLLTLEENVSLPKAEVPFRIEQEKVRFREETSRSELEAKFDRLYADLSDDAAQTFSGKLETLITTVKNSIPNLNQIEACVDEIEAKECKNNK